MKKTLLMTCAVAMVVACVQAQSWLKKEKEPEKTKGWIDNFEQAQKEAEAFKQPDFRLLHRQRLVRLVRAFKKEALDTKEFEKFAADNLILFEADFPRAKKISDKVNVKTTNWHPSTACAVIPQCFCSMPRANSLAGPDTRPAVLKPTSSTSKKCSKRRVLRLWRNPKQPNHFRRTRK